MSRIGNQPIELPKGAKVKIEGDVFVAEGPKGKVHQQLFPECPVSIEDGVVTVGRNSFFAINSTVGNDVVIGAECFIGANALVTKDLADGQVVIEKSTEVQRLNSAQFLRISRFH